MQNLCCRVLDCVRDEKWIYNGHFRSRIKLALHPFVRASACCLRSKISQIAIHSQGTRKTHYRTRTHTYGTCTVFYPADHTQRPAEKNWHAHYFLRASCDYRFAGSPQGPCTKNVRCPCILLACRRFKMVCKSDLQIITGHVLVPYFPLASKCIIPKHVRAECVNCTTAVLEAHLARTTRKSHARLNIQFSYGWCAAHKLVARATCSTSTTHFQTPRKHYVLYGWATVNKSAEPVRAKTRTAGCKAIFIVLRCNAWSNYLYTTRPDDVWRIFDCSKHKHWR